MQDARNKLDAAFEFFTKLDVPFYCFHDRDMAPEGEDIALTVVHEDDDVIVIDLFGKVYEGTYSGANLSTAIATRTQRRPESPRRRWVLRRSLRRLEVKAKPNGPTPPPPPPKPPRPKPVA